MCPCSAFCAVSGGRGPHKPSTRSSIATTSPTRSSRRASSARCCGRTGVRSTPSASTSSLPRSRKFTRIESDTGAARYDRVTRPADPHVVSSEKRSVVPVPELSLTEERIVLLVAQGRSRREIAAVVGLDARTVDWHLAQANRKLEKASALLDRVQVSEPGRKS